MTLAPAAQVAHPHSRAPNRVLPASRAYRSWPDNLRDPARTPAGFRNMGHLHVPPAEISVNSTMFLSSPFGTM
jgi:hypothetical protein